MELNDRRPHRRLLPNDRQPGAGQLKLPGTEHIAHHLQPTVGGRTYLRFGNWPANERSRNNVTGELEDGVSVYELYPHTNEPMDPDPHWESPGAEWADDGRRNRMREFHQGKLTGFHVSGRETGPRGHDGEPLLWKVQHERVWEGPAVTEDRRPKR